MAAGPSSLRSAASIEHATYPPVPNSPGPSEKRTTVSSSESFRTAALLNGGDGDEEAEVGAGDNDNDNHEDEEYENATASGTITSTATATASTPSSPVSTITPAMQMRLGLTRRLCVGVLQLRKRSRFYLLFQACVTLAQVAVFATMLALSTVEGQTCRKPLRTYLSLHIVRVAFSFPLNFYNALAPPSRPPRGEEETSESIARRESLRVIGSPAWDARLRTLSDLIALFGVVLFCLGNVWVYTAKECKTTSPYLWWSSIATLIIAYMRVAEIVIIVLGVVFFLPLVILGLRLFGGLEKKHEIGPLSKEEIAKLPVVLYIPSVEIEEGSLPSAQEKSAVALQESSPVQSSHTPKQQTVEIEEGTLPAAHEKSAVAPQESSLSHSSHTPKQQISDAEKQEPPETIPGPRQQRHFLRRLLFQRRGGSSSSKQTSSQNNGTYVATAYPLHPLPDNLSSCPICLADYEPPPLLTATPEEQRNGLKELEPLNLLPCNHAIHKACLAPWLQTSGRCPVCQRAILEPNEEGKSKKRRRRARTASSPASPGSSPSSSPSSTHMASASQEGQDTPVDTSIDNPVDTAGATPKETPKDASYATPQVHLSASSIV